MDIRHPEITVQLSGEDGNPFFIIGRIIKAFRRAKISEEEILEFRTEAESGDYDHVLQTCMKWVDCA